MEIAHSCVIGRIIAIEQCYLSLLKSNRFEVFHLLDCYFWMPLQILQHVEKRRKTIQVMLGSTSEFSNIDSMRLPRINGSGINTC